MLKGPFVAISLVDPIPITDTESFGGGKTKGQEKKIKLGCSLPHPQIKALYFKESPASLVTLRNKMFSEVVHTLREQ